VQTQHRFFSATICCLDATSLFLFGGIVPMKAPQSFSVTTFAPIVCLVTVLAIATHGSAGDLTCDTNEACQVGCVADRIWLVSTRHLENDVCRANLDDPSLVISQVDSCGRAMPSSLAAYRVGLDPARPTVIYVHGNRTPSDVAITRGLTIYRFIQRFRQPEPIDWVIWSWPSEKQGILIHDAREKARRTDAHGMYLAWFLREHAVHDVAPAMIGYSFGGRIVTGSLHALAGGSLGGRRLPGPVIEGTGVRAGLVAPAVARQWLLPSGYHGLATQNLDELALMYNHRDVVLKHFWMVDRTRHNIALGYGGPLAFGPRNDGTQLPVVARDFARTIGNHHNELDYYLKDSRASSEMARLIHAAPQSRSSFQTIAPSISR